MTRRERRCSSGVFSRLLSLCFLDVLLLFFFPDTRCSRRRRRHRHRSPHWHRVSRPPLFPHSLTRISLSLHSPHMQGRTRSTASRVAPVMMIPSPAFRRFLFHHPAFMSILHLPSCLHTATRDARLAGFPPDRPVESDQGCREEEAATGRPKRRSKGGMDRALLSPCFSLSLHGCWAARLGFLPRSPSFCLPLFPAGVGSHTITEIVI